MPSWVWAVLLSAVSLIVTIVLSVWRFGLSAGRMARAMELLEHAIEDVRKDSVTFRVELQALGRHLAVLEERLTGLERRLEGSGRFRIPPGGMEP